MIADPLIARLGRSDRDDFVNVLGALYEHSPWVAHDTWPLRPFADRTELHDAMQSIVLAAGEMRQLALIRAHPDLAGKLARAGALHPHSTGEQQGLGLDRLPDAEYEQFDRLNRAYRERFGFPFIIAVRAQTRASVLAAFGERLGNDPDRERRAALAEIGRIAWFRLQDLS